MGLSGRHLCKPKASPCSLNSRAIFRWLCGSCVFLNAVNMSVWLFLAFIDFSRQRQFWLLPVPQILHFVNGSDHLPGFPTHPTLCACRLFGISCAVWLYVGDWTAVGGVCFVFYEPWDFDYTFDSSWRYTRCRHLAEDIVLITPTASWSSRSSLAIIFSTFYGFPGFLVKRQQRLWGLSVVKRAMGSWRETGSWVLCGSTA